MSLVMASGRDELSHSITGTTGPSLDATGLVHGLLTDSSPVLNAVMVVLAEPIGREVGLTHFIVPTKVDRRLHPNQCWPWLQNNIEDSVHVLIF